MSKKKGVPPYKDFMNPILQALRELGGSGTIEEIENKVIEITGLTEEQTEILQNPDKGNTTKFSYRVAWARTYLKKYGAIENSERGVWTLTAKGKKLKTVNKETVRRFVKNQEKEQKELIDSDNVEPVITIPWRAKLLETLQAMEPSAFERLAQRILRESGFTQVTVTGKSGDGGIDGKGVMRLEGLLSFHVFFQCKRYQGNVSPSKIRDFRGAMAGRADKGLFITTGGFTKEAIKEATRDGAPPLDLIDGEQLIDKLKELKLGVKTEMVEEVTIDKDWFMNI